MGRTRSQILLAQSSEGEVPVSSSPHPTLAWVLNHPGDRDRFSQISARPARPVQAGHPLAVTPGSGVQAYYLLLHSCGKGAGGDIHAVSSGHVLATGCAPHINSQVVLDAGHQLGTEGTEGTSRLGVPRSADRLPRLPLTETLHLSPCCARWPVPPDSDPGAVSSGAGPLGMGQRPGPHRTLRAGCAQALKPHPSLPSPQSNPQGGG